jgi:hypothetical protein
VLGVLGILFGGVRFGVMGVFPTVDVEPEALEVGIDRASDCEGFGPNERLCEGEGSRWIGCDGEQERERLGARRQGLSDRATRLRPLPGGDSGLTFSFDTEDTTTTGSVASASGTIVAFFRVVLVATVATAGLVAMAFLPRATGRAASAVGGFSVGSMRDRPLLNWCSGSASVSGRWRVDRRTVASGMGGSVLTSCRCFRF